MRSAVMSDDEVEPRVAILVALANSAKLLPQVFTKQELKQRKKRIEQLEKGEMVSAAAKQAVAVIEAAVMVLHYASHHRREHRFVFINSC